jgi:hypothetical protein
MLVQIHAGDRDAAVSRHGADDGVGIALSSTVQVE